MRSRSISAQVSILARLRRRPRRREVGGRPSLTPSWSAVNPLTVSLLSASMNVITAASRLPAASSLNHAGSVWFAARASAAAQYQIGASQRNPRGRIADGPTTGAVRPSCMVAPQLWSYADGPSAMMVPQGAPLRRLPPTSAMWQRIRSFVGNVAAHTLFRRGVMAHGRAGGPDRCADGNRDGAIV